MPDNVSGVRLEALILADFVSIREGLLTVVNGGVTRTAIDFPGPPPHLFLGMMFYIPPDQTGRPHEMAIAIRYVDTGAEIARLGMQFGVEPGAGTQPGEGLHIPLALPLLAVPFTEHGQVDIMVSINGANAGDLSFWLVPRSSA